MPRLFSTVSRSLALVALVSSSTGVAVAQNELPGSFGEVIDVRVINLEVVVVDRDGVRVTGLKPEDFRLDVDGRETPIEYFTEVHGGTAVARGDEGSVATLPALAPGQPVGTSYLVFIDEYFSFVPDRDHVLRRMIDQLPLLAAEDRMAIVAFDGKQLDMLSTWTNDVEGLERVLKKATQRPTFGLQRVAELKAFGPASDPDARRALLGQPRFTQLDPRLDVDERMRVDVLTSQLRKVTLAATSALRSFANPPGRKVMLLLSGGWPYNAGEWIVADPARSVFVDGKDQGDQLYRTLVDTANRLSYTLYPVDVPGLVSTPISAADVGPFDAERSRRLSFDQEQDQHLALSVLAERTGGRALLNGNGLGAFQAAVEDTRSYYWIGFTPSWKGDDASHKVKLTPRDRKMKLRSRSSYSDLARATEVTMMVESALLFGNPPSAAPLEASLGAPSRSGVGKVKVPLSIKVPLHALTFLPQADGWHADTELRVAVLDGEGNTADIPVVPLPLLANQEPTGERFWTYETSLEMRNRHHDVVVSLYDVHSGTILSSKLEMQPRK